MKVNIIEIFILAFQSKPESTKYTKLCCQVVCFGSSFTGKVKY